jgi:hypothetical protein
MHKVLSVNGFTTVITLQECSLYTFQETRRQHTVARRRVLIIVAVGIAASIVAVVFWAKGSRDMVLDGTLQRGFEESVFFRDGDCSNKPFWWEWPNQLDSDLDARWKSLGKPTALRVKVRGNLSSIGLHGHLGAYRREVQPVTLISVSSASPCQWTWVKETQ